MSLLELNVARDDILDDLEPYQQRAVRNLLGEGLSEEAAAQAWVTRFGSGTNAPFGSGTAGPGLFENLKAEFNKLVCGDSKYKDVRKKALDTWKNNKTGLSMVIAAAIGSAIGVSAVVIVPAVALLLAAAFTVGINAWCSTYGEPV